MFLLNIYCIILTSQSSFDFIQSFWKIIELGKGIREYADQEGIVEEQPLVKLNRSQYNSHWTIQFNLYT